MDGRGDLKIYFRKTAARTGLLFCRFEWSYFHPDLKSSLNLTIFPRVWTQFPVGPENGIA